MSCPSSAKSFTVELTSYRGSKKRSMMSVRLCLSSIVHVSWSHASSSAALSRRPCFAACAFSAEFFSKADFSALFSRPCFAVAAYSAAALSTGAFRRSFLTTAPWAWCRGVSPNLFFAEESAPSPSSTSTTSSRPTSPRANAATCSGVSPFRFSAVMSAPQTSRTRTTSTWPQDAATCSGVFSSWSSAKTSAPAFSSNSTTSVRRRKKYEAV
mmetsp:Transcript_44909/g.105773  ORF Transcript_44909/g.105773 Transcript_44909/m.105773 type:complete len:212 (+) Transcript_44909:402-1037(+)